MSDKYLLSRYMFTIDAVNHGSCLIGVYVNFGTIRCDISECNAAQVIRIRAKGFLGQIDWNTLCLQRDIECLFPDDRFVRVNCGPLYLVTA